MFLVFKRSLGGNGVVRVFFFGLDIVFVLGFILWILGYWWFSVLLRNVVECLFLL